MAPPHDSRLAADSTPDSSSSPPVTRALAADERARKRAAVGLSPQRPTAKSAVMRPPKPGRRGIEIYILPAVLVLIIVATVAMMVWAGDRIPPAGAQADWSWAWLGQPASPLAYESAAATGRADLRATPPSSTGLGVQPWARTAGQQPVQNGRLVLHLTENFSLPASVFATSDVPGRWRTEQIPRAAIYRMEVWPNHVAWSLLDAALWQRVWGASYLDEGFSAPYRMQTAATVAAHTPWGYAGLAARVVEGRQLVLFVIDGRGRFRIQSMQNSELETVVPWTEVDALNPAGTINVLTIEDDGHTMRFYGNQYPLFQITIDALEWGELGIAAGALVEGVGETRFAWFQLYGLEQEMD